MIQYKYFIKTPYHEEVEVSKKQFIDAEKSAGFYLKFDDEPATWNFGDSKTGIYGRQEKC